MTRPHIELPTADGRPATWQIGYFGAESGAYNPRVRERAAPRLAQPPLTLDEALARANAYLNARLDESGVQS